MSSLRQQPQSAAVTQQRAVQRRAALREDLLRASARSAMCKQLLNEQTRHNASFLNALKRRMLSGESLLPVVQQYLAHMEELRFFYASVLEPEEPAAVSAAAWPGLSGGAVQPPASLPPPSAAPLARAASPPTVAPPPPPPPPPPLPQKRTLAQLQASAPAAMPAVQQPATTAAPVPQPLVAGVSDSRAALMAAITARPPLHSISHRAPPQPLARAAALQEALWDAIAKRRRLMQPSTQTE